MARTHIPELSRRERQIMDIIYRLGQTSAAEVLRQLPDPPSYSAVRTLLGILERKGRLKHVTHGLRYLYLPVHPRHEIGRSALQRVLHTFFEGSMEKAVAARLADPDARLTDEELERLAGLIREARKKGR
jgi:predicted transcriptional regulator